MGAFIIGEIGINHNGSLALVEEMIKKAKEAGCDAIKFQKRTIDLVYTQEFLASYRESPWGTTQRQQKEGLEFGYDDFCMINKMCEDQNLEWFASVWDVESVRFINQFNCKYNKIASAMLANKEVINMVAAEGKKTFISTGMSTVEEIDEAVNIFIKKNCPYEVMHCVSTYPMDEVDANLLVIDYLRNRYRCNVGYSGHEKGYFVSLCAVAHGATSIERHITLDKTMYGSDQKASLDFAELGEMVNLIRRIERICGSGEKKLTTNEIEIRNKLRGRN